MSPYAPNERVLVSPRYMAGAGDRIADVLGPLIQLFGWKVEHDAGNSGVGIDSPDGSACRSTSSRCTRSDAGARSSTTSPARSR